MTSTEAEVERLAREVAELRAENAANRAELEAVRAHVTSPPGQLAPDTPPRERDESPKRRLVRRRGRSRTVSTAEGEAMSRRRLLGLAGTAAAAGVGGALLAASPAEATTSLTIDGNAATNSGLSTTFLTTNGTGGSYNTSTLDVQTTKTDAQAIRGEANGAGSGIVGTSGSGSGIVGNSGSGPGVSGLSATGNAGQFFAPTAGTAGAHLLLAPSGTAGAPTGAHTQGQFWVDSNGKLFQCVATGTPGTWVNLSSPLVTLPPTRVYDSRPSQLPPTAPRRRSTTG